ncbi:GDSL esterase/lipase [Nymphaea thermarum]|nr:GDSL esterase/lipase [Nymphaea thermarum]
MPCLSEKLGLPRVPPFYGMNRTTEGVISGLNFGSLTAGLLYSQSQRFSLQGVNTQLRQALEAMQLLQISYGQERARELASRSLFYISAGANDYLRLFLPNVSGVQRSFTSTAFARFLVRQMSRVIKDLYGADVRKIVCAGIPPLGCTPRLLWERYNSSGGISSSLMEGACVDDVNKQVLEFNVLLSSEIAKLQDKLPGSTILFCDVYQGIMNIIREPGRFGFSNVKNACCGVGPYGGRLGCRRDGTVCSDRETRVWWDLYNPTAATNSLLAEWMWADGPLGICAPVSIHHLTFT